MKATDYPLVAIGSSAGGPGALAAILRSLSSSSKFLANIVIVQHMDARFAEHMAKWLGEQSSIEVSVAKDGDRLVPGKAFLAGLDSHLVISRGGKLNYVNEPSEIAYRPSVDVFFESVLKNWRGPVIGVLLTGMGRDGAHGLLKLREAGASTIVQDQSTSAVYGMPKAAAEIGAADEILSLSAIGPRLIRLVHEKTSPAVTTPTGSTV